MIWFVLLVLWPLAELFVIVKVSEAIGFLWMLLLLIVSWPIGSRIIRHEGRAALRRLRDALAAGRAPTNEVLDGALVLVRRTAAARPRLHHRHDRPAAAVASDASAGAPRRRAQPPQPMAEPRRQLRHMGRPR